MVGQWLPGRWSLQPLLVGSSSVEDCRLEELRLLGYTSSVKTAVSIPDDIFEEAERLVDRLQSSRSQLDTRALAEFVARYADHRVEATMNAVVAEVGPAVDEFTREAARKTLRRVEW